MILTKEELNILKHHYRVKAACDEAQGLNESSELFIKSIDSLDAAYKDDLDIILRQGD